MRRTRRFFTVEDDNFIRTNYLSMSCRDIARDLDWSIIAIRKRACKIGASKPLRRWNKQEDEIIRSLRGKKQLQEVAKSINRSRSEVSSRIKKLGLGRWRVRKGTHSGRPIDGFKHGSPVFTHRRVVESIIGRRLRGNEIVHHIDFDKFNNAESNLLLFKSRSAHRKAHSSFEKIVSTLVQRRIIFFDRASGLYKICETIR